jgi:signal transduction histidine kinase
MVMIWAVCLLATLIVVSLLVRRIIYPLVRLNILAKSVNAANLDANRLVLADAPLEVESLVDSYNQLLDRLSLSWRNQREFVGAVSHELRNPLTLISGYLRRTLRQAEGLSDTHRKGLLTAESEAKRIGRLLNDLLELAKSDSGRLSLILNPVDLEPLLIEVAELARESFLRAIDFVVLPGSGSAGKPINANADSDRLKQVVLNLIENSDKYSPRDSPITITLQQLAGAVLIRVCDQGVGVPKEDIPFIFQRFYRASNVSSVSGSGLGLSVVKLLVDAMGGEVSVENDVVQGTCFRIRLESDGGY